MKNKYDEAYCRSEKKNYALDDVTFLYHNDFITYATVLDGDLLCPDCHKVRLSFVNSSHPHFRGYRGEDHLDGCMYALEEMKNIFRRSFVFLTVPRTFDHCTNAPLRIFEIIWSIQEISFFTVVYLL